MRARGQLPDRRGLVAALLLLLAGLTGCASSGPLSLPPPSAARSPTSSPSAAPAPDGPSGSVTVAYPAPPAAWLDPVGEDLAALDLAALWGLPLYRLDEHGQLRDGLVETASAGPIEEGWAVRMTLRPGTWSDGTPVVAADVAATVEALRDGPAPELVAPVREVRVEDERTAVLVFAAPYARWPDVLWPTGVLPRAVLEGGGLAAYHDQIPVSGGPFRLAGEEPGLAARFVAHDGSPLGPPRLEELTVTWVGAYETALGLVAAGEVEVVTGHLAVNPVERAARVAGTEAAAPLGGTWVGLAWRPDGELGGSAAAAARTSAGAAVDVASLLEGLLPGIAVAATSPYPGVAGPWTDETAGTGSVPDVTLVVPGGTEQLGFVARVVQRDIRTRGSTVELRSEPRPSVDAIARETGDGILREFRTRARPALVRWADADTDAVAAAADAAPSVDDPSVRAAFDALAVQGRVWPLYATGPAHVWHTSVRGVVPSAWPGLAFASAAGWTLDRPAPTGAG